MQGTRLTHRKFSKNSVMITLYFLNSQWKRSIAGMKFVAPIGFIIAAPIGIAVFMKMVCEVLWMCANDSG